MKRKEAFTVQLQNDKEDKVEKKQILERIKFSDDQGKFNAFQSLQKERLKLREKGRTQVSSKINLENRKHKSASLPNLSSRSDSKMDNFIQNAKQGFAISGNDGQRTHATFASLTNCPA